MVEHTDADIVIVDRHGPPGAHRNDACPFVALHQPSVDCGVASVPLGSGRTERGGLDDGLLEPASGAAVAACFQRVMHEPLLPTGRVRCRPLAAFEPGADGTHAVRTLLDGERHPVRVRRRGVDGTYCGTSVPSTHRPSCAVAEGAWLTTATCAFATSMKAPRTSNGQSSRAR